MTRSGHRRWLGLLCLSLYASTTAAASILPSAASSSFPQCGLSCTILTQAQTSCESGAESTWVSCFCQSALLTTLKTSGSVCSSCSSSDQSLLSTWYNTYCNSNGKDTGSSDTTSTTTDTATATSSASTASATAVKSTSSTATADENKSWWSTHYQWVIMLIVLAVGFSAIAAGGVWLKRRYDAKRPGLYHAGSPASSAVLGGNPVSNSNSGVLSPPPPAWASSTGPKQSQSLASSSRTDLAATRGNAPPPGSRTRLPKPANSEGDVEIRQISLRQ